jgi:membrane-associated phospholipid phosphatase
MHSPKHGSPLLSTTLLILLFAFITITVELNALKSIDEAAGVWVQRHITPLRTEVLLKWTSLGSSWLVLLVTVVVGTFLAFRRRTVWFRWIWSVPACVLSVEIAKRLFQRPRPVVPHPILQLATYSFPSGHAAAATVLYCFLAILICSFTHRPIWRVFAWFTAVAAIGSVAFSRLYLGVHYLTDVAGGIIFGLVWLSLFARLAKFRQ